ncbi:MAG: DUF1634 domain-containing protein [Spirochaetia bacterium]|jgi:uncharacterized membrane protein
MGESHRITDRQIERGIGSLLRTGVICAAVIALAGDIWYLGVHGGEVPRYGTFRSEPAFLRHIPDLVHAVLSGRSAALIQLGLLVLIAVPIARVAVSILAFALQRDWLYVGVTVVVLIILLFSLLGGII